MFRNYLKTAFRNLWKRKLFSAIHILGMGIAFASAIFLFVVAARQLTFDNFHQNGARIYQLYFENHRPEQTELSDNMPVPLASALRSEISSVEKAVRISSGPAVIRAGNKELSISLNYTDADFLEVFSFPLREGNIHTALQRTGSIVLTAQAASRFFGNASAVGKTISLNASGSWQPFVVSAVLEDLPVNSSIRMDALTRFEHTGGYRENTDRWSSMNHNVFVELKEGTDPANFEKVARAFVSNHFKAEISSLKRDGAKPGPDGQLISLKALPLSKMHFSKFSSIGNSISIVFPWLLVVLSIFILFIASTNFINLSLAGSFTRSKEIGVRKVLGAGKRNIVWLLWGEALLTCVFSLLIGAALTQVAIRYFGDSNGMVSLTVLLSPKIFAWFTLLFVAVTAFAGGYPALIMSRFNTILTLKGVLRISSGNRLRNILTGTQFVIAILMISSTLVISRQINYLRNKPLGYNKSQVISIPIGNEVRPESALKLMRAKVASLPDVRSVTAADINLGRGKDGSSYTSVIGFDYNNKAIKTNWLRIDYDYLKTLDIKLLAGRDFSRDFGTDTAAVLINERMAAALGEKDPVGKVLPIDPVINYRVVGVVSDFHFKSLHEEIMPLTMTVNSSWPLRYIFVKVSPDHLPRSMSQVREAWSTIDPAPKAEPTFLDENTNRLYKGEEGMSQIFIGGAVLTILISCMGLFAIALFMMEQRTKEIGIRKVLGASVPGIVSLLSGSFARLILLAFLVAGPLCWFLMSKWLETFAYRTSLHWWTIAEGGALVLLVAMLTVGIQATRAALANPVRSLKVD